MRCLGVHDQEPTFAKLAAGMPCANKNSQTGLMSCSTSSLRACRQHLGILIGLGRRLKVAVFPGETYKCIDAPLAIMKLAVQAVGVHGNVKNSGNLSCVAEAQAAQVLCPCRNRRIQPQRDGGLGQGLL